MLKGSPLPLHQLQIISRQLHLGSRPRHINLRAQSTLQSRLLKRPRLLSRSHRLHQNGLLTIQGRRSEVNSHHLRRHQQPLGRQLIHLRLRPRFRPLLFALHPPPQIRFITQIQSQVVPIPGQFRKRHPGRKIARKVALRKPLRQGPSLPAQLWQSVRPRHPGQRPRCLHPRLRRFDVLILRQRLRHQRIQIRIPIQLPPLIRHRRIRNLVRSLPSTRLHHLRLHKIRAHRAPAHHPHHAHHHRPTPASF